MLSLYACILEPCIAEELEFLILLDLIVESDLEFLPSASTS